MIDIKELSFRYNVSEQLFSHLNLSLNPGNICGLLGRNGAGKTTLLKLISGLLFPQEGSCQVFNHNPQQRLPQFLEEIYFLPEEFYIPNITIKQYEKLYAPFYHAFDSKNFHESLQEFSINKNKRFSEMSYGQKKKCLIAFGIATNSRLLLLDEPTNGLDIPSKSQFRKLLARSITDEKIFIVSTHQVREVENLIDPIVILDNGKIIFNQFTEDFTKQLAFESTTDTQEAENALYAEKTFNGYRIVSLNQAELDSQVDLEMLFNAVIENQSKMQQLFEENHHE